MNVYLTFHGGSYNLGLQELTGSLTSEALMNFLSIKLADFDLDIKDIIGITSDGANVMLKLQKSVNCFSQVCLDHGINISVKDSLLSEDKEAEFLTLQSFSDDKDESVTKNDINNPNYNSCVTKIMKVFNRFSHSGLLVDKLKHYRETGEKKPLKIITYTKTRWNLTLLSNLALFDSLARNSKVLINISADTAHCLNQDEINQLANI